MTSARHLKSAADWCERIDAIAGQRCDLEMLLKDEWRHRVAVRDDGSGVRATQEQELVFSGQDYTALKEALGDRGSLAAFALATLHSVLHAYGHGHQTVIAFLQEGRVLPVIVDHLDQAGLTCAAAAEQIDDEVRRQDGYLAAPELLQRGLFDALLVLADRHLTLPELPPSPLVAIVRDDAAAGCLHWTLSYAGELFEDKIIAGVLDVVREVLGQFIGRPEQLVADLDLVSAEQELQLHQWNGTDGEFDEDRRLDEIFEDVVRRAPDREAVVCGETALTYREINERANQFAHWLLGAPVRVQPEELIGLYLDKSELGVVATFGIWKAGAAYVPIDPAYPAERIRFIVGDTRLSGIVTNRRHADRLREVLGAEHASVHVIEVEAVLAAHHAESASENPGLGLSSRNRAYVTYTSGTTGVPKGVPKYHYSVVNSITDLSERYDMRRPGTERVALFASYVFEPHLRQTLIALINEQTLVIVPDDVRLDPDRFPEYIERYGVTYLNATGSVLQHFDLRRCPSLRKLLLVGEELTAAGLRQLRERFTGHVVNEYAFTEAAFVTAIKEFAPGVTERRDRSIGRPLRNVKWYVLSQGLKQLPIGAIGELYIGGCGVAPGYLNRDDLTAERFTANPFQTEEEKARGRNGRLYRTGDLARVLLNGEVEFMGRSDFQLKLNGVRVEPGEIEAQATEFPGVRKCVVVAKENATGGRHLVGYYIAEDSAEVTEADLLAFLEQRLIRIMVPARMVPMSSIPVNVNGKVDWRALPDVSVDEREHVPADGVLGGLREIWSDVLGVPASRIGDGDDFFRLGGQSISCILLIARVRQRFALSLGVEDVFALRTLGALAGYLEQQALGAESAVVTEAVTTGSEPVRMLANGLQQGLLYHHLKTAGGDDAYVVQSVHHYHAPIRPELMKDAWQLARQKYPALRLRFEWGDEPVQIVDNDDKPFDWRFVDLSTSADAEGQIRELQERDRTEPYELAGGRLFRVYLIKQRDDLFSLIFSCHHIILDGWSLPVLHDEVHRGYLALLAGRPAESDVDNAYVAAQRYWESHRNDHAAYWVEQLGRIDERGDFAGLLNERSRYRVSLADYDHVQQHRTRKLCLGADLTEALQAGCAADQVTLHSVLQFVWHKVLHAIGGGNTTVVGTIVSGRNLPVDGIEHSAGLYINTLPLIVDHDEQAGRSVAEAVRDIQATVNTMNTKSIVELGRLQSGEMKRRLFDTLLVLENYPRLLDEAEEREHQELLRFEKAYDADKVDYPIAVVAREEGDELTVTLWYAGELFDEDTIDTLLEVARTLFRQVAEDISRPVRELDLVSPAMLARFDSWNETAEDFPADKTLHAVFEQMAARWPDEIAVVYRENRLTYRELNERANRLAHYLRSVVELRPDDLVALVLDKSELMITAIIAAWKTGAAYVPIDSGYPDDRIAFMLEDTAARLVVTNEIHSERLRALPDASSRHVLEIELLHLDDQPATNPVTETTSTDLAYAIYTSGTTGKPKAVLVEHRGVVNLQVSLAKLFNLGKENRDEALLSFSNYIFDHFVEQMTDALLNGQKLVVLDDSMRTDPERLCRYMNDEQVTYLSGTPSVLSLYDYSSATSLTRIDAIGEDFTEPVFSKIRGTFPGLIINGYGPTEISITSHKRPYPPDVHRVNKSIGFPVANTKCHVLNKAMKPVPVGGIGELYIGGIGVTRGYLNREDLTADRFVDNPFQTPEEARLGENGRLYKTGDLVRWLPNGEVEYLGRTDLQVKIRGQRVELGEVEAALSSYPGVVRSLVVAREHAVGQKYLVGFYVGEQEFDEQDLKQWMRKKLPESVVPARVLRITDIPVTPSGKLDARRLPETDFGAGEGAEYVAPVSEFELKLCGIWSQVLEVAPDRIGVHDDFFALGGDSIRAMALAQAITTGFGQGLGVATVLQHTTLAAQAEHIQAASLDHSAWTPLPAAAENPPVSLAQERLLFIDDFEGGTAAYNIPFVLRLPVEHRDAVPSALGALVRRHPALHTLLKTDEQGVRRQFPSPTAEFRVLFSTVDSRAELDEVLVRHAAHVFRLHEELPIRAELVEFDGELYLSVVVHHTCFDGWSWDLFRRELAALLDGAELGPLRGTYGDFAVWQRQYLTGRRLSALTEFWTGALGGFETIGLPLDHPRPPRFDYRGRELEFELDARTTEALRELARTARVSLYSVLLGAWCVMLNLYTGQHDLVIGTPSANRGRPEFDRTIGFFANLLALRVRIDPAATVPAYVRSVGEAVVAAQVHGELPFEQLVKELAVEKDPSRHPILQLNFTLQNVSDHTSALTEYKPDAGGWTTTKFDLSATLTETATGLAGNLTYAAALFDDTSASGFIATFKHVLAEFAGAAAQTPIAELTALDSDGQAALLSVPAEPATGQTRTLHAVFEEMAAAWPDEIAVVHGDARLTYRELNERANRLAHHLRSWAELRGDDLVGLVLDQTEQTIVAILAVWKAGAAYLPVDPSYPDERIAFMLSDTGAKLVLAGEAHGPRVRGLSSVRVLDLEQLELHQESPATPVTDTTSTELAYAIYTSGTTGKPKAVLVSHGSVDSFRAQLRYFGSPGETREAVLFLANYVFDFSVEQLALSVLGGHKLIVPPPSAADDPAFYELANREGLSYLSGTPTQVQRFDLTRLTHLRRVLVAGEAFQPQHFDKLRGEFDGPILNAYGTTETTVYNTVHRFEPGDPYRNTLGTPLGNTRLYVLGDGLKLLPTGAVGELYVAGECVTEGYLHRPELTRERFLPNPFPAEAGRYPMIYRTGDVVRRGPDGELQYLGRNDAQVKINGLRIEPGEVEAVLAACPGVRQSAVLAGADPQAPERKRLVGYYLPEPGASVDESDLLAQLRARLMPSMVPSLLVRLDRPLPMTITGKLDVDALPSADFSPKRAAYAAPRDRVEARLCQLWSAQLPGGSVGIDDDFFRSGGDSISALHLASQVQREVEHKISVKHVFDYPTVRQFADHVLSGLAATGGGEEPEQGRLTGECPMLPIQEWFFAKPLPEPHRWNHHFAIQTPPLDPSRLRAAVDRLVDHHDAFRLRFPESGGQVYAENAPALTVHEFDVRDGGLQQRLVDWQSEFDLADGPTACAAYLHGFEDGTARVWFAVHHLVVDTVSWHILAQDLEILYNGGELGAKTASYRQWAQAVREYTPHEDERRFWADTTRDMESPELLAQTEGGTRRREEFALTAEHTRTLLADSPWAYDTEVNDLLLTATGFALRSITRQPVNHLTVEGHGRELFDGAPDVRDTVGWFTTMHPFAVEVDPGDLGRSVRATKENRRRIPHHGIGYGALFGGRAPLPAVSFNYLGRLGDAGPEPTEAWRLDAAMSGSHTVDGNRAANRSSIDVTMSCTGGRLVAVVDSLLGEAATRLFASELKVWLERLIAHTATVARNEPVRDTGTDLFDPYILVNEDAAPTLFVLPPGEGGAESYLSNIARELPEHRLVLFNNVHLHSPMGSFEELGRYYVEHIRRLQPSGPYHLLGWSFGGVLSLEISRQLARAGERIADLLLIDPYFGMRQASASIGLPEVEDILDPINYHYLPDEADLARLADRLGNLVLFKAGELNDVVQGPHQPRMFEFYQGTPYNNLDLLLPAEAIELQVLEGETHHSWVRNTKLVKAMCERISSSLGRSS
ncbi:non-ribosomal peptide synthetase [Amycolatopsis sp. 195334CR]|uniref:non-ribosomal peptide synthetase n=1 Tax=Amycolatopsis sp. 195334CR TaxID=2814588 RepID=UPI001A8EB2BB|nr:non-ribosomal peptide synthetase [Amycolatopsis sp. 195334CR]MBN6037309.1 amino acid adenylation domain-containing protein [Amycolatopsis sp. 195334CR]